MSAARNLEMIAALSTPAAETDKPVFYDAEHFLMGSFRMRDTLDTLRAAHEAGADRLILCDTNGGMLPSRLPTR